MKQILILVISLLTLACYAQKDGTKSSNSAEPSAISFKVIGETECCYGSSGNTYEYIMSQSGGFIVFDRHFMFSVTDGVITHVNGISYSGGSFWSQGPTGETYFTFTVDWDDEAGQGRAMGTFFYNFGTGFKESVLYPNIGEPIKATGIDLSNTSPWVGETIACTAVACEGANTYNWSASQGVISGSTITVPYTPASAGTATISVTGTNSCGTSMVKSKVISIQAYGPLSVYITGPSKANNTGYYDWVGHVSGGKPTYDYVWYYSYTGQNYNNIWATLYNTSALTHTVHLSMPLDLDLYLKLVVTDDLGDQDIAYFSTMNTSIAPFKSNSNEVSELSTNISDKSKSVLDDPGIATPECSIYPNPTSNEINIPYEYFKVYNNVTIYNSRGIIVVIKQSIPEKIDLSSLTKGLYFVVFTNQFSNTNKILKVIKN